MDSSDTKYLVVVQKSVQKQCHDKNTHPQQPNPYWVCYLLKIRTLTEICNKTKYHGLSQSIAGGTSTKMVKKYEIY